jgi:hypothetical protein
MKNFDNIKTRRANTYNMGEILKKEGNSPKFDSNHFYIVEIIPYNNYYFSLNYTLIEK